MSIPQGELLFDIRERLVRLETKLDTHATNRALDRADVDGHETRITKLESNHRLLASLGAVAIFLVTFFQTPIARFLGA